MKILFIGEAWLGSCARSLKEALARQPGVVIDEVNLDLLIPKPRTRALRAVNRILMPLHRAKLWRHLSSRLERVSPDVVMVYKGYPIESAWVNAMQAYGALVVNVYPDCSPHAHGAVHRKAVGVYDLVISTKPFHPNLWSTVYAYYNRCVFVPQGYDPALHLVPQPIQDARFDVVMVATWRPEYGALMQAFGKVLGRNGAVGIAGNGWEAHRGDYPPDWVYGGERQGRAYLEWLRQGSIAIAPLTREVVIEGHRQPGDEDSTRTYELAAARCFFIHRRTPYVQSLYDESSEVPMFDTPEELAAKVLHYLDRPAVRQRMAAAAHIRAVPAYSLDARAGEIISIIAETLEQRKGGSV
jgi:spore maturation protein CgeB